ncbi:GNAT family N-acetyltransferase [Vibrio sonorensis]|uniref:GNAT family N-acetyltransferase n=1 Tax=Vibrio sonorensis TaxID=1004316 RepID=UPI0008D984C3|nr:GNAT family N-acetyltransferase [Vibrio sonorensis]
MDFQQYNKTHRSGCIAAFDSNLGKYFDQSERQEFIDFLDSLKDANEYYVCTNGGTVIACGGIEVNAHVGSLAWGMVHRDFHGQGYGKRLAELRLSYLKYNDAVNIIKIQTSQHAEGFYKKRGFMTSRVVFNGLGEGIDCVDMQLSFNTESQQVFLSLVEA